MPRRLGQHFLADQRVLRRIAAALRLTGSELVVEIGAGRGALTRLLAQRAALVVAIELDSRLAALLRQTFAAQPRVHVLQADILEVPLDSLVAGLGYRNTRAVGNLPYYITSPILLRLFAFARVLEEITVMVQREVAERLTAAPGSRDYGLLSVTAQYYTRPQLLFRIGPAAFRPPPKVDSALVRMPIAPRSSELAIADDKTFLRFVGACFRQKRKTLLNNLKGISGLEQVQAALEGVGLPPAVRAEQLSLEQFAALHHRLQA